jgi:hypothetical protein
VSPDPASIGWLRADATRACCPFPAPVVEFDEELAAAEGGGVHAEEPGTEGSANPAPAGRHLDGGTDLARVDHGHAVLARHGRGPIAPPDPGARRRVVGTTARLGPRGAAARSPYLFPNWAA